VMVRNLTQKLGRDNDNK